MQYEDEVDEVKKTTQVNINMWSQRSGGLIKFFQLLKIRNLKLISLTYHLVQNTKVDFYIDIGPKSQLFTIKLDQIFTSDVVTWNIHYPTLYVDIK